MFSLQGGKFVDGGGKQKKHSICFQEKHAFRISFAFLSAQKSKLWRRATNVSKGMERMTEKKR